MKTGRGYWDKNVFKKECVLVRMLVAIQSHDLNSHFYPYGDHVQ